MGCLPISDEQFGKVLGYLDAGKKDGATAVAGGDRSGDRGYFVQPTILTDTTADMSERHPLASSVPERHSRLRDPSEYRATGEWAPAAFWCPNRA